MKYSLMVWWLEGKGWELDGGEKAFKAEFLEKIQQEVSREMAISHLTL